MGIMTYNYQYVSLLLSQFLFLNHVPPVWVSKKHSEEESEDEEEGKGRRCLCPHFLPLLGLHGKAETAVLAKQALNLISPRQRGTFAEGETRALYMEREEVRVFTLVHDQRLVLQGGHLHVWLVDTSPVVPWSGESPLLGPVRVWRTGVTQRSQLFISFS